jgi:hypothetical protein
MIFQIGHHMGTDNDRSDSPRRIRSLQSQFRRGN